jgi:exodeoxyribonuclease VII large subunit
VERCVERAENATRELGVRLRALSPQSTLDRGYAIAHGPRGLVRDPQDAPEGSALVLTLARGVLGARSTGEPSTEVGSVVSSPASPSHS